MGKIARENYAGMHTNFHIKLGTEALDFLDKYYYFSRFDLCFFFFSKYTQVNTECLK